MWQVNDCLINIGIVKSMEPRSVSTRFQHAFYVKTRTLIWMHPASLAKNFCFLNVVKNYMSVYNMIR
jgi:hypothetical protein